MTKAITAILALALAVAVPALAQNTTQPSPQTSPNVEQQTDQSGSQPMQQQPMQQPPDMNQPAQAQPNQAGGSSVSGANPQASQTLTGTISADGKTFNGTGATYNISNPNSVKPFANQPVTVEYDMDANNSIHITRVILAQP